MSKADKFVHLHLHSEYSLLDGANRVDELVDRVVEMGQPAVSITDHGRIASVVPFVKKCAEAEIKPIIGCEMYILGDGKHDDDENRGDYYHLTLLVLNSIGFQNMVELTSKAYRHGFHHRPRIDKKLLADHSEGLMLLTGCIGAEIPQMIGRGELKKAQRLLKWYQEEFDDRVRIELMYHGSHGGVDHTRLEDGGGGKTLLEEGDLNDALIDLARSSGTAIVATNDAHYLHERDGEHHDTLICKGKGKFDPDRTFRFPGAADGSHEFYVKDGAEMRAVGNRWKKSWKAACDETVEVAKLVDGSVIDLARDIIPTFEIPFDPEFINYQKTGER